MNYYKLTPVLENRRLGFAFLKVWILPQKVRWRRLARRKPKGRGRSRGRGSRARSVNKKHTRRSKRTTVVIETQGRGPKRTTVYEEVYEQEW